MQLGYMSAGLPDSPDPSLFTRQDAGDDSLFVVFYMGVLKDENETIQQGRPIFNDVECVRIIVPGDKSNIIDRPADRRDRHRFAKQYAMFKQGLSDEDQTTGSRLSEWPLLTRAQAEELRHVGIRTVEQLAEVRDDLTSRIHGLVTLKQHAQTWLGKTKTAADAARQTKQMNDQKNEIDGLKEVVREQAARLERLLRERADAA